MERGRLIMSLTLNRARSGPALLTSFMSTASPTITLITAFGSHRGRPGSDRPSVRPQGGTPTADPTAVAGKKTGGPRSDTP